MYQLIAKYILMNIKVTIKLKKIGYNHKRCNHVKRKFVVKDVHGTYHNVSPKYLQNYVDKFAFRFNLRQSETPIFNHIIERIN
jgi:hypothetical protein